MNGMKVENIKKLFKKKKINLKWHKGKIGYIYRNPIKIIGFLRL